MPWSLVRVQPFPPYGEVAQVVEQVTALINLLTVFRLEVP